MENVKIVSKDEQLKAQRAYMAEYRKKEGFKEKQRQYQARWLSKQALKMAEGQAN